MNALLSSNLTDTEFDIYKIWQEIVTFFTTKFWNIILFFSVLVVGIIAVKLLLKLFKKMLARSKMEQIGQAFVLSIIKYLLYLVLVLALLSIIGVNLSGVLTAISAAILAVGMALQGYISNLASGIIIVTMHMINKCDFISIGDVSGTVTDINFLFTTVNTTDCKRVTFPNSNILGSSLTNYGVNKKRRVDFTFSVAYESDVESVKETVKKVMNSYEKVYKTPEPFCRLKTLGSSSIDFFANCWCNAEDYWDVYYYVTENVFNEFKRGNISIPYNQTEVRLRTDEVVMPVIGDKLPERVETVKKPSVEPLAKDPIARKWKQLKNKLNED